MIIKKFTFEEYNNLKSIGHLKYYYYKTLNKTIRELYDLTTNFNGSVVCLGKEPFTILKQAYSICTPGINFEKLNFSNFISLAPKIIEKQNELIFIGYLIQRKIYYDSRLKNNLIVIGVNISEIEKYIIKEDRKEKIKKIYKEY